MGEWEEFTVDGITALRPVASNAWADIGWRSFARTAKELTDRLEMSDGFVEPFADAGDVTIGLDTSVFAGFGTSTSAWVTNGSLPVALASLMSVIEYDGYVYIVGGYDQATATGFTVVYRKTKEEFKAGTGAWVTNGVLPYANLCGAGTLVYDGYIYIIGGQVSASHSTYVYRKSMASFVAGTGTWDTAGSLPGGTVGSGISALCYGGYVYLVGGYNGTTSYSVVYRKTISELVSGSGTWVASGSLPLGGTLIYAPVGIVGDSVLIVGGTTNGSTYASATYYKSISDFAGGTGSWVTVGVLPTSTYIQGCLHVIDGVAYLVGGYNTTASAFLGSVYKQNACPASAIVTGGYCANGEISLIPVMTSNTAPAGYTVTASSALSGYDAYKAANQTSGVYWDSIAAAPPHWWAMSFPSTVKATRYRIKALGALAVNAYPTSWTLQGSNNGTDWTDLDERTSQTPPADLWWSYSISVPSHYSYYRVYFTGTSHTDGYLAVDEIELYKAAEATVELSSVSINNAAAGIINFTAQNMDAAAAIDIGNSGSNAVEVKPLIDGVAGSALSFTAEDLGDNLYQYTSETFDLTNATAAALRFKTYDRGSGAPNLQIYGTFFLWRAST